jgi:hypothetical protein
MEMKMEDLFWWKILPSPQSKVQGSRALPTNIILYNGGSATPWVCQKLDFFFKKLFLYFIFLDILKIKNIMLIYF